jgi:8-oxo-dGTP pyrophosphatase MutT (NUDIX family)
MTHFEVVDDARVGAGGFLVLRRLRLRVVRADGTRSAEGLYDFVERPKGLDAVVLALWNRGPDGIVRVLVRDAFRVPLVFGRPDAPAACPSTEVVAGILEAGEEGEDAIAARAVAEAWEEAGVVVAADAVERLGAPLYPTPGMCAEKFVLAACEVADPLAAARPPGDGSPFEEGAQLRWLVLDDAIEACVLGEIEDMKTEVTLRRLRDYLARR